ncbi:MAG: helix-turn-helix domain-containing protein [Candidatus Nanopelagicales bacterium]
MTITPRTPANADQSIDVVAPILLTPEQAARALGLGRTTIYALLRDGELRSVRLGRSRRIPYASLVQFVERITTLAIDEPAS